MWPFKKLNPLRYLNRQQYAAFLYCKIAFFKECCSLLFIAVARICISQFNQVCYIAATCSLKKQCLMEPMKLGLRRLILLMGKYLRKGLMKTWHISENQNTIVKNAGHRKWWALMWFWWSTAEVWREAAVYLSAMDLTRGNLSSSIYNWPPLWYSIANLK